MLNRFQTIAGTIAIKFLLFICISYLDAAEMKQIEPHYTGDDLEIRIPVSPEKDFTVSALADNSVAIRIENDGGQLFRKSADILWKAFPVAGLSQSQKYSNVYLKLNIKPDANYRLTHTLRADGLHLYLRGEVIDQFKANLLDLAVADYSKLSKDVKNLTLQVFAKKKAALDSKALHAQFNQARMQHEYGWMNILASELHKRHDLTADNLKQIATINDSLGNTDFSEGFWYEYYQLQVKNGDNPYVDKLPETTISSAGPTKQGATTTIQTPKQSEMASEFALLTVPSLEYTWLWLLLLIPIGIGGALGLQFWKSRPSDETERSETVRREQMEETFAARLQEMRQKYDSPKPEDKPEKQIVYERPRKKAPTFSQKAPNQTVSMISRQKETHTESQENLPRIRKRREIEKLHKQGLSITRIARKMDLSVGEVKLLLKINEGDIRKPNMRLRKDVERIDHMSSKEIARFLKISEEEAKIIQLTRSKA